MRLVDPKLDAMRNKRLQAASDIEQVGRKLLSQVGVIKVYDSEYDDDWPIDWPIPEEVTEAIQNAVNAAFDVEAAIASAKNAYRRKVLAWLLAEAEAKP